MSLRDPVKRAYSHYWHFSSGFECNATLGAPPRRAPECFHASVVAQIDAWRACEARVLQETKAQAFPRRSETQADASIRPSTPLSTKDPEAVVEVDQCAWGDRSSSMVCLLCSAQNMMMTEISTTSPQRIVAASNTCPLAATTPALAALRLMLLLFLFFPVFPSPGVVDGSARSSTGPLRAFPCSVVYDRQ